MQKNRQEIACKYLMTQAPCLVSYVKDENDVTAFISKNGKVFSCGEDEIFCHINKLKDKFPNQIVQMFAGEIQHILTALRLQSFEEDFLICLKNSDLSKIEKQIIYDDYQEEKSSVVFKLHIVK